MPIMLPIVICQSYQHFLLLLEVLLQTQSTLDSLAYTPASLNMFLVFFLLHASPAAPPHLLAETTSHTTAYA